MGHRVSRPLQADLRTLDHRGIGELADAALRATAHGTADLTLAGHLSPDGKGRADATGLVSDLLSHLAANQPGRRP